ncbi:unnamed protein product [Chilo suppressalis]|uniref:Gamma-interferon-inducible lysosomal thiol reductase n=1 Tax=Chilo suppressalis TaxID=168631 RepID=A0ABN8B7E6_CHISP|nr:hypothetical protein evm_004831 [Chilo suppressalis]CAH0405433.1 unnamed protein product [Chilo suppressalis]
MYRLLLIIISVIEINSQEVVILSNVLDSANTPIKVIEADVFLMEHKFLNENVKIQLYYECLCPDCRKFDTTVFARVYNILQNYLDVHTYPYGNAQTITHADGTVDFECQHGVEECYGNMLHACAIDILANTTASIEFNMCLMDYKNGEQGSNDATADKCGELLNIKVESIKKCAKGDKGKDLLKYYGDESHKVHYNYVPYVLINGVEWNQDTETDFMKRVCQAFKIPPPPCEGAYNLSN